VKLGRIGVVGRKELVDGLRDRRAIYSLLIGAVVGPALISFMFTQIASQQRADRLAIPVIGAEHAPLLIDWLEQQSGVEVLDGPEDPEEAVREGEEDFVLVISEEFGDRFSRALPAPVQIVGDGSDNSSRARLQRLRLLVQRYSLEVGSLRLVARGVSPSVVTALSVDDVEVSSAAQRAAMIFNMVPLFMIIAAFTSAMQIATDSTAGERERGSLESLLLNPVPRGELVLGKWLAAVICSVSGMVLTLGLVTAALSFVPFEDMGIRYVFDWNQAVALLAITLPVALVAPAAQIYLASFARTFKEAQTYMGFMMMIPMLGMMGSFLFPEAAGAWLAPIPVFGQFELATEVMGGESPSPLWYVFSASSLAVLSVVFLGLTSRLFRSERLIVGR
jgi:sodium transport system permease protein